jgi:cell division cycle 2-like protein
MSRDNANDENTAATQPITIPDESETNSTKPTSSNEGNVKNTDERGEDRKENGSSSKLPPQLPMLTGCRSVDNYKRLNKIEEGTYGVVYRAQDKQTGEIVALKKLKMDREREGFPMTSLREVKILMTFKHTHIVDVKEIVVGNNLNSIFIVMEYVDHDLKTLMEEMKTPFLQSELKTLMIQLLSAMEHLHDNWVIHRDLKTSNLLYNNKGQLKVADFGLAREYGSPLKPYTHNVVTLWYRAPELLLGQKLYTPAIDMWSVGCIFAELISKEPLMPGRSELDQIDKIFKLLGTANEKIWPGFSQLPGAKKINFAIQPYNNLRQKFPLLTEAAFDLLNRFLTYDPAKRITAAEALRHPYFMENPPPKDSDLMPTWPSTNDGQPRKRKRSMDDDQIRERELLDSQNEAERFMDTYRDRSYGAGGKPLKLKQ